MHIGLKTSALCIQYIDGLLAVCYKLRKRSWNCTGSPHLMTAIGTGISIAVDLCKVQCHMTAPLSDSSAGISDCHC